MLREEPPTTRKQRHGEIRKPKAYRLSFSLPRCFFTLYVQIILVSVNRVYPNGHRRAIYGLAARNIVSSVDVPLSEVIGVRYSIHKIAKRGEKIRYKRLK